MIQKVIDIWHRNTFGDSDIENRLLRKFKEESEEFLANPTADELADCMIVLFAYASRKSWDAIEEVTKKFEEVSMRDNQLERDKQRGIH